MSHRHGTQNPSPSASPLARVIDDLAHLLPGQGPISIFIHHNTLHAFEQMPFEEAVEQGAARFACEPFLSEARYRTKLASGRILAKDVESILAEELGSRGADQIADLGTRLDLWRRIVLHGIPAASGRALSWLLEETSVLSRFRTELPRDARQALSSLSEGEDQTIERKAVRQLWETCLSAVERTVPPSAIEAPVLRRHRDLLLAATGVDSDAFVHPLLIRFIAGYLDQGLAHWVMPDRDRGIHGCFLELYRTSLTAQCGPWARALPRFVAEDRHAARTALASIEHSLTELGVTEEEWPEYLASILLALRGWAGMVRQIEERPDRVPATELPATLGGYLAVRLLCERAALEYVARHELDHRGPLSSLRRELRSRVLPVPAVTAHERAWPIFQVAQLCGLDPSTVDQWASNDVRRIESELAGLTRVRQRQILHRAYERAVRHRFYDALIRQTPLEPSPAPVFQAVFCLDEREESFRRHLEEVEPEAETFGAAGFFNVAMYHQGATDAHPRPLCPVVIRPEHYVPEIEERPEAFLGRSRRAQRRAAGFLGYNVHHGSRMLVRGALLVTLFGGLVLIPLVLRVLFPWLASRWGRVRATSTTPSNTRLRLERDETTPPIGTHAGFTVAEMAGIVRRVLEDTGIAGRLSALVFIVGHGSVSLNNPHESAHDCGACGGGRGGPNARAFAQMANDPRVRALLAREGLHIEASTWFVGAQRNTCDNSVMFFDDDRIPADRKPDFARAREAFEIARRREAHERCRRFDAAPTWYPALAALAHVEARAADLAQPRPEYGHATNAFCVIGRRSRTAGLFLDRRAFLVSYDPTLDRDGAILTRVMAAVVPVVAGISLEYYFSFVDPTGYGCGTKLPHNVTSLLGVMDGAQSDLRTGLPWQMVEIHEPSRLAIVVEAPADRVLQVVRANASIQRLVSHRWIWLACLDPHTGALSELRSGRFVPHTPEHPLPVVIGESATWYQGKRGFLPPVRIVSASSSAGATGAPA
ncbi:MAG TPA: DUF2309 domain-containing protein [Vicinamibacterales bacterium]|jgi:hypothetical protein